MQGFTVAARDLHFCATLHGAFISILPFIPSQMRKQTPPRRRLDVVFSSMVHMLRLRITSCISLPLPALLHCLLVLAVAAASGTAEPSSTSTLPTTLQPHAGAYSSLPVFPNNTYLDRSFFPDGFVFGTLTLAVKHEGKGSGEKADSIWDYYARQNGTVIDGSLPGNAGNEYAQYEEDISAMVSMGMDAFRFSIPWTRIFPNCSAIPNAAAIAHYNDLIDKLIENGIEPHVTLWSEDHPQALEDAYGGLLSPLFIDDFITYANVCFAAFGDRVKYWITFDEPNDYAGFAYASIQSPPGRCTPGYGVQGECTVGNSSTEPYLVAHNILLAHSAVAKLYKANYKAAQGGFIGMALWFKWYEPLNITDIADLEAARRAQDFFFGWFMDPLVSGEYPQSMRTILGSRLPTFTEEEASDLRQSMDFVGLNAVTALYVTNKTVDEETFNDGYYQDMRIVVTPYRGGEIIGKGTAEYSVPWCLGRIVDYMKIVYGNPPIFITETGWGIDYTPIFEETLNDTERVEYFYSYYATLSEAIRNGGNVQGVFAWSLIDGFEYVIGLHNRFGLIYVDEDMVRYPRLSAFWFQQLLTSNSTANSLQFISTTHTTASERPAQLHVSL